MTGFVVILLLVVGVNTLLWSTAGASRAMLSFVRRLTPPTRPRARFGPGARRPVHPHEVAVLIAAHNEGLVIGRTIASAAALVPVGNLFVASDGSSDDTAALASAAGANVLELDPNRGKAGAITAAVRHFELSRRFKVVLLLDADTHLSGDYLITGLPLFSDPRVVAVAGRAESIFTPPSPTLVGRLLVAYRERLYVMVQYLLKYGQAARAANVVSIVPGFASMYRTRVLASIDIDAPGLTIEDFNMTFEIHAKRLGRIAFHPHRAIAYTQDPDTFRDYTKQVRRWTLGFWQTVRRHRYRTSRFWLALVLYIAELLGGSVMMLLAGPLALVVGLAWALDATGADESGVASAVVGILPPYAIALGVLVPDAALTVFTAVVTRRPVYLAWGVSFLFLRTVDAAICLQMFAHSFRPGSTGVWASPERRPLHSPA